MLQGLPTISSTDERKMRLSSYHRPTGTMFRPSRQSLESSPTSPAGNLAIRDEVAIALENLDNGIGQVLEVQTEIGARLNLIDTTEVDNEDVTLVNKAVQADLSELDYAEALSRLSFQTVILEAAQQSYVKIAGLNLFNQLR